LDKQKQLVVDVLTKKGEALCNLLSLNKDPTESGLNDKIEELYTEMQRWVDPLHDVKAAPFVERYLTVTEQPGKLIRLLMKAQEEKATVETENKLVEAYKKLDWQHAVKLSQRNRLNKFPPIYRPL
ncbi:tripeptidyl-peptidase 2-like, partial [Tropilaelaps mercedesae]